MKYKQFIIGFISAIILIVAFYYLFQGFDDLLDNKIERVKNESFNQGKLEGLLYTQTTGNIVYLVNETLQEESISNLCNNLLQQQLNNQEEN